MTSDEAKAKYKNGDSEVVKFCESNSIKYYGREWYFGGDKIKMKYHYYLPYIVESEEQINYIKDAYGIPHDEMVCTILGYIPSDS